MKASIAMLISTRCNVNVLVVVERENIVKCFSMTLSTYYAPGKEPTKGRKGGGVHK